MANTITYAPNRIVIVPDGSTVYDSSLTFPNGLRVTGIQFYPSAVNDVLEVRHESATGTVICRIIAKSGDVLEDPNFVPARWKPYIKVPASGENVWNTAADVRIVIEYA